MRKSNGYASDFEELLKDIGTPGERSLNICWTNIRFRDLYGCECLGTDGEITFWYDHDGFLYCINQYRINSYDDCVLRVCDQDDHPYSKKWREIYGC